MYLTILLGIVASIQANQRVDSVANVLIWGYMEVAVGVVSPLAKTTPPPSINPSILTIQTLVRRLHRHPPPSLPLHLPPGLPRQLRSQIGLGPLQARLP